MNQIKSQQNGIHPIIIKRNVVKINRLTKIK